MRVFRTYLYFRHLPEGAVGAGPAIPAATSPVPDTSQLSATKPNKGRKCTCVKNCSERVAGKFSAHRGWTLRSFGLKRQR